MSKANSFDCNKALIWQMTSVMAGEETWIYGRGYRYDTWVGGGLGRWLVNDRGEAGGEH